MGWLLFIAGILVHCPHLLWGRASEYQLESDTQTQCQLLRGVASAKQPGDVPHCFEDGSFRPVQCSGRSQECWCVDADGQEIPGTRTNSSSLSCPSVCQLQTRLRCSPSGLFEEIQCDSSRGQCWCVDQDGMELYGTRQNGRPHRCPGSCQVRARRLLHSSGSPPQCAEDGSFLPVQCKFINMTDRSELDLLHAFNRFPEAFQTFSRFRKVFPMVSSYCFCSNSRGRELENTGVELLLSEIPDSAFSSLRSPQSFSQTNVYRVLQRRMLGVRLAASGLFRCPSPCEEERRVAMETSSVFVPTCESGGSFSPAQCQQGGQCWCVDPSGREVPGSRRLGPPPACGSGPSDCPTRRRRALSRLLSAPPLQPSSRSPAASCSSLLQPLRDLLPEEADYTSFLSRLVEVLDDLFPSVGGALMALNGSSPRFLQDELFGGDFLRNAGALNFSGAVGDRGALSLDRLSPQNPRLQQNQNLVRFISKAMEDPAFFSVLKNTLMSSSSSASLYQVLTPLMTSCSEEEKDDAAGVFIPRCTPGGAYQEVQCRGSQCWCVDSQGLEEEGSRVSGRPSRCPSLCERARINALKAKASMAAGVKIHIPSCSEDGDFLPLQCVGSSCFCVDAEGRTVTPSQTAGGALTCPERVTLESSAGRCSDALAEVSAFKQEVNRIISLSNSSHIPLGYGFLLAEGLRLTPEELQILQSEEELQLSEQLLSGSKAALPLAAFSTLQMLLPAGRRSYQHFLPQCDADGEWLHTQCSGSTGQCWCVDENGEYVSNSLKSRSVSLPQCLSRCQRAEARFLLSDWTKASDVTSAGYRPQCEQDGRFSVLQTGGAAGWCVNLQTGEPIQAAGRSSSGQLRCPSWCELQGRQCGADGSFIPLQCDVTSCWCVSEDGQEVAGTRTARQTGAPPSCDRPLCPAPTITNGALVCRSAANGHQSCDLVCNRGYENSLPVSFLCDTESGSWNGDNKPLGGACQISQPLQTLWLSQVWSLASCSEQVRSLLFSMMTSRGLCSAQLGASGRSVSLCDDSSVSLQCDGPPTLKVSWSAALADLPTSDLPDLQDVALFLNESRLLDGVRRLLRDLGSTMTSQPRLVSMTTPSFGCSRGYRLDSDGNGCVVCPAGSFFQEGACLLCPEGTYQAEEGRDFCNSCPRGSSPAGASSVDQCETECERRSLRCSQAGDFLPAQPDLLTSRWSCFSREGEELEWTSSSKMLTDDDCSVLSRFQEVPGSELTAAEDTDVLQTLTSDLLTCIHACAAEPSCHHVALFSSRCELYSTDRINTLCNASQPSKGFLGNPEAERYDWLSCSVKVRGVASDLLVLRKRGEELSLQLQQKTFTRMRMTKALSGVFRTQVFSSRRTSLSDAHRFCQDGCSRHECCDGFVLHQNSLEGGSLLCGWLRSPSVLSCQDGDWDVTGQGSANRICGAGLNYNKEKSGFLFDFGGQTFTISDYALPADSQEEMLHQASIVSFQAVYLSSGSSCAAADLRPPLDGSLQQKFEALSGDAVVVDPQRKLPVLSFWLNKQNYDSQQALLWCLARCDEEQLCAVADLADADSAGFFSCSLHPDSRVCGAYDMPPTQPCPPLMDSPPTNAFSKKVDLSGPVQNFYERVPFQRSVSNAVLSRAVMSEDTPLSQGFRDCERRCDEDPCCRGFGFVGYNKSPGLVCLVLVSLGVQTCSEDDSTWRSRDCSPTEAKTSPYPFGWYQKPVNQWTSSPALCPPLSLPETSDNVSSDDWRLLPDSLVLVDPSLSTYDVLHVSRDVAADENRTRDWCLHACWEAESCVAVSLREAESATRCILYPDTTICGLSSSSASSCQLVIREPASQVYLRTERTPSVTSVSVPGHGMLKGVSVETTVGSDRRTVIQFLGVPYARPPIGMLRFEAAQPADWRGTWDASKPRPSCVQPGDGESSGSSEDCLYLNVFTPAARRGRVPVLVFFFNPSANESPGLLDGSALAATGNIVVVTASYRTAALGFLSTGASGLSGNYGLTDQEAVLRWVNAHISLMGGDNSRVTVGAEQGGADILSLHLLSRPAPLFQRMMLMGGSVFSPSLVQSAASSRRRALDLAQELGCTTSDSTDEELLSCLRTAPVQVLNAAQTKLLVTRDPFQFWSPVHEAVSPSSPLHRVDLLLGTSEADGLISRARRIKEFEVLPGQVDDSMPFYQALSRVLGGANGNQLLREAVASLDHNPSAAGYSLFSRALNNATRDLFIICPALRMAGLWADSRASVFLYHQPAADAADRTDSPVPWDVQLAFGAPLHPQSSQRFTSSDRRLSLGAMSYVSSFIRTGNPNPWPEWAESVLPRWQPVTSSKAPPSYMELSPALRPQQGLSRDFCSPWGQLVSRLSGGESGELGAEPVLTSAPSSSSQS
ncbi:thyroglobulin isoform X2 [Oryzias melastigma]|uniref:thyroglobulin isoform X2 n=1 Tax=Oryzias melastigma TaxID=30732 RepID=UPI000CF7DFFE|nr:thyroglobulin isoform X2 [Oryzias melastigma]